MTKNKPTEDHPWNESMFIEWKGNYNDFFSEHDTGLDDGFEYLGGKYNETVGLLVDGRRYLDSISDYA